MEHRRTDAMLMEVLRECKNITGFFDAIFGFLKRNTDFYHIKTSPTENIGFPKGMKEKIIFSILERFDPESVSNELAAEDDNDDGYVPPAVDEIEIEAEDVTEDTKVQVKQSESQTNNNDLADKQSLILNNEIFALSDYKNGACFENYCWSQTLKDVEVHVVLPRECRTSRSLSLNIESDRIRISDKKRETVILEGALSNKCKQNNSVWTVADDKLIICLDKTKEGWWDKLFTNEPMIDIRKIKCETYIDELPESSQVAIEKLRIQQMRRDKTNRPASTQYEDENLERLRKAWNVEGSPFQGLPFDPSMVDFQ